MNAPSQAFDAARVALRALWIQFRARDLQRVEQWFKRGSNMYRMPHTRIMCDPDSRVVLDAASAIHQERGSFFHEHAVLEQALAGRKSPAPCVESFLMDLDTWLSVR